MPASLVRVDDDTAAPGPEILDRLRQSQRVPSHLGGQGRRAFRETLRAIFQDPFSSLDPSRTIGEAVGEPLQVTQPGLDMEAVRRRMAEVLHQVGLEPVIMNRFPAEFSGGQRQRIAIARAFILKPEIVVCDEAASALDVSVRA